MINIKKSIREKRFRNRVVSIVLDVSFSTIIKFKNEHGIKNRQGLTLKEVEILISEQSKSVQHGKKVTPEEIAELTDELKKAGYQSENFELKN